MVWDSQSRRRLFEVPSSWAFNIFWKSLANTQWSEELKLRMFFIHLFVPCFQLPRFPNSVASLSCNHNGDVLAIAASYTYQEANEL